MTPTVITPGLTGVVAAPLTPFRDDGAIDTDAVPRVVEFLLDGGVAGLMVGGSTGEFIAQTPQERSAMVEAFVKAVDGAAPVIAHVGHVHPGTAQRLARLAIDAGADALTALTPYYHRTSPAAVEQAMRELLATARGVPFFVYDYPDATGNALGFASFKTLMDYDNLAGIKLSVGSIDDIAPYIEVLDQVSVLSGNDMLMPAVVQLGGTAVVSGNAAAFPDLVTALLRGLLARDNGVVAEAPRLLSSLSTLSRGGAPDRLRELLRRRGVDLGVSRIRTYLPHEQDTVTDDRLFNVVSDAIAQLQ